MKLTYKTLVYFIAFFIISVSARAQESAVPDTTRFSAGLDVGLPNGGFNNSYLYGLGASLQVDLPITLKLYFTGNIGFNTFIPQSNIGSNPEAIENVKVANIDIVPIKIGLKYFLIRTFYIQGEVGESFLANKSAVYGYSNFSPMFAPQMGILFKLHHKNYIDAGVRYEWFQSFYGDTQFNRFFGIRVAYAFNLK